jgi:hypothetical protein
LTLTDMFAWRQGWVLQHGGAACLLFDRWFMLLPAS